MTELVFILDKSGSMSGLENDTIGGYNSMLKKQKEVEGDCVITTVLFDNNLELLHDRIDIKAVNPITDKEYTIGGMTALCDAIGMAINKIDNGQKHTAEDYRAEKVMFVIITDGYENSSRKYTSDKIKKMIEQHKKEQQWEFVFLGANIDAVETANEFGINADRASDYVADSMGTSTAYEMMGSTISCFRQDGELPPQYLNKIRDDAKKRGKH